MQTSSLRESTARLSQIQSRQNAAPPFLGESFVRLAFHSSIVLGNTLYIDGGEVSWNASGEIVPQVPNNDTLTIDLSQSWVPSSVPIGNIPKDGSIPVLNYGSLWAAPDNQSFYSWAGSVSRSLPDAASRNPAHGLWQFKDGSWALVQDDAGSIFSTLNRPAGGVSAFGNGRGYYLGGFNGDIDPSSNGPFAPDNGLVTLNLTSNAWNNASASDYSYGGTAFFGGLQYVPNFGTAGLLVAIGGEGSNTAVWQDNGKNFRPFSNISVYDPSGSGTWYSQEATGFNGPSDIPQDADMFCTAGVQSDGGTYEIFMYGGHNNSYINALNAEADSPASQLSFKQVYVLSLPGFVWFRVNDTTATPRLGHTCEVAGNRQMISIGGLDPAFSAAVNFSAVDLNHQGLGVFDMVDLAWTNTYDATAAPYTAPDPVKEWYNRANSNSSIRWSSPQLQSLFLSTTTSGMNGTNGTSGAGGPTGTNPNPNPNPPSTSQSSSPSIGAIVGGVVGGAAALAIIALAAWLSFRRKRRMQQEQEPMRFEVPGDDIRPPTKKYLQGGPRYPSDKQPHGGFRAVSEMHASPAVPEKQELESPVVAVELESPVETTTGSSSRGGSAAFSPRSPRSFGSKETPVESHDSALSPRSPRSFGSKVDSN